MKLVRSPKNPILKTTAHSWEDRQVYNAAVAEYQGKLHLIYRAQGKNGISRLGIANLSKPDEVAERKPYPIFEPDPNSEYETYGVEDPRVSKIDDIYYLVYVASSSYPPAIIGEKVFRIKDWRVRVSLTTTTNFSSYNRYGVIISHIDSKDAALFPEKIDGSYVLLHRVLPKVRIAVANDLRHFKERGPVFEQRKGMWDNNKVGVGAPPLKTPYGWILFYHGADNNLTYRLGIALLDLHDPSIIIARAEDPVLEPEESYEKNGFVPNVVFTCGVAEDKNEYFVYYGAADSSVCLATIRKEEIFSWAKKAAKKGEAHALSLTGEVAPEEVIDEQRHANGT